MARGRPPKNNQMIKNRECFDFFEYFDFEKIYTEKQTDIPTDICPYRSDLPLLKNRSIGLLIINMATLLVSVQVSCKHVVGGKDLT